MNILNKTAVEKSIKITETDIVNGGEVLVLIAYAIKENDDLWSYPSPQIFNPKLYEDNKEDYNNAVKAFRASCEL